MIYQCRTEYILLGERAILTKLSEAVNLSVYLWAVYILLLQDSKEDITPWKVLPMYKGCTLSQLLTPPNSFTFMWQTLMRAAGETSSEVCSMLGIILFSRLHKQTNRHTCNIQWKSSHFSCIICRWFLQLYVSDLELIRGPFDLIS